MKNLLRNRRVQVYCGVGMALLLLFAAALNSSWQGNTQLHTIMEVVATQLALIVGIVALVHFYAKRANLYLLLGIGFFGTAFLDGYHAVVTSQWFDQVWPSPPSSLIPWSWNASRVFLSVLMLLSWIAVEREQRWGKKGRISERSVYLLVTLLTLGSFLFFAFVPLPPAYYEHFFVGRPEEFVAASLFLAALVGYLARGKWKTSALENLLVVSLVISVATQSLFMASSFRLFDGMFNLAHLLKIASYAFVMIGLLASMYDLFTQAEHAASDISDINEALNAEISQRREAEREMLALNETLEKRIADRTAELESQKLAALNMMADAQQHRARAETAEQESAAKAELLTIANENLRQSEERFQLAVAGTSDGLWDWDVLTNKVWYAPRFSELLGYEDGELPHEFESFRSHLHLDDEAPTMEAVRRHLEDDIPYDVEHRLRTKSGQYRWFRARGSVVRNQAGEPIRMAGSIQDITEKKLFALRLEKYAADLQRSNKELDDFAYVASHDLKSPLRGIDNLAKWVAEDLGEDLPAEPRQHLCKMQQRVQRMETLLNDLLHYSRAGRMEYETEHVDTKQLVEEIVDLLALPERFSVILPDDMPAFDTVRTPLEQVFMNLIANAVKHHDRVYGRIEIAVHDRGDSYEFTVSDDGPGIDPKFHQKIFRMFQTLQPRDKVEGSGVGLALIKKTVESYGGSVTVDSELGQGTTFRFTWPKNASEAAHPEEERVLVGV